MRRRRAARWSAWSMPSPAAISSLLGLAVNAAGACFHPVAVLLAGRLAGRDTSLLVADVAAVLLVYAPLALLVLGRRRAVRRVAPRERRLAGRGGLDLPAARLRHRDVRPGPARGAAAMRYRRRTSTSWPIVRDGAPTDPAVVARIRQEVRGDYVAAARALDRRGTDVVVVQHEYGIFGGADGEYVLSFADELRLPLVVTLHTVLGDPSERQAHVLARAVRPRHAGDGVHRDGATDAGGGRHVPGRAGPGRAARWTDGAAAAQRQGTRRQAGPAPARAQRRRRAAVESVEGRRVLATFGLISPGKGIEIAIEAMPAIVARHPDALLLVAGRTHPEVVKQDGERYRLSLERRARELGLLDHVALRRPLPDGGRARGAARRHRPLPHAVPLRASRSSPGR